MDRLDLKNVKLGDQDFYWILTPVGKDEEIAQTIVRELPGEQPLLDRDQQYMRLFSAAPELLDALKLAIPLMEGALAFVDCKKQIEFARAAIRKAEKAQ